MRANVQSESSTSSKQREDLESELESLHQTNKLLTDQIRTLQVTFYSRLTNILSEKELLVLLAFTASKPTTPGGTL